MMKERGYGKTMICLTCLYWAPDEQREQNSDTGDCCYNPPVVDREKDGTMTRAYPSTYGDDWCGKWGPAEHVQPWADGRRGEVHHG